MLVEERSATLELRLRNLEKRVFFENGAPTGCESNLLHETLGRSLVEKGKLTDAQHHTALAESAAAGKSLQGWLLEKQLVSAFELFKHLQATLGRSLLDAFRWTDATWKLAPPEDLDAPVRINPLQLIFTGCQQLPVSALVEQLATPATTVFGLLPGAPAVHDELKLSPKETRLLQAIKRKATLAELIAVPGLSSDDVHRRLYALRLLEFIDTVEAIAVMPVRSRPTPVPQVEPIVAPAAQGLPFLDDDPASQNLLVSEFLSFRTKDAFEVLGVDVDTQGAVLQRAFLAKSLALVPTRFKNTDARARAESLQLAYAKAFGALSETETWQQHRARRAARGSGLEGTAGRSTEGRHRRREDSHRPARRAVTVRRGAPETGRRERALGDRALPVRARHRAQGPVPRLARVEPVPARAEQRSGVPRAAGARVRAGADV